jgi:hypothetical protein
MHQQEKRSLKRSKNRVKKVLLTTNPLEIKKKMAGEGKIKFGESKEDPVNILQPKKLVASVYVEYDMTLPYGKNTLWKKHQNHSLNHFGFFNFFFYYFLYRQ